MSAFIVYQLTNVLNEMSYVGWTNKTLEERWYGHCCAARRGKSFLLSRAIREFGSDDSIWQRSILETCSSVEEAKLAEVKWIAQLSTNQLGGGHGYNMTAGGDGQAGTSRPDHVRAKISESLRGNTCGSGNRGLTRSEETRTKIREALTGRVRPLSERVAVSRGLMGRSVSIETRAKISKSNSRRVLRIAASGEIVEFASMNEAKQSIPKSSLRLIRECCNGKRKQAYEFVWRWM